MRIIIAQGTTISTQLAGLKEKEEAIDNFEERMHNLRMRESGRDYLLHTYLDQLPEVRPTQMWRLQTDNVSHYSGPVQRRRPVCDPQDQQEEGGQGPGLPRQPPLRRSEARGGEAVDRGPGQAHQDQRGPDHTGEQLSVVRRVKSNVIFVRRKRSSSSIKGHEV